MLDTLNAPKRALVQAVKEHGPATVGELATHAGLAETTVRQHLDDLLAGGVVSREARSQGRGRPSYRYRLTEAGHTLYPSGDGVLLQELLRFLKQGGHQEAVVAFFHAFWAARATEVERRLQSTGADHLEARAAVLVELLAEQGFMPRLERDEDGNLTICESNCPYRGAVRETSLPCRLEAEFIERALKQAVRRIAYLPAGDSGCTYEVEPG